uniref:(northern house mosquito) hypothetical protein n=1 Tax=Culex pipiens TaxID=7175 RepID=A0A8D8KHB6_CULPI
MLAIQVCLSCPIFHNFSCFLVSFSLQVGSSEGFFILSFCVSLLFNVRFYFTLYLSHFFSFSLSCILRAYDDRKSHCISQHTCIFHKAAKQNKYFYKCVNNNRSLKLKKCENNIAPWFSDNKAKKVDDDSA